jgi:murein DD-endopeptidase MepM/ murein hydrolase activator NlpD
MPFLNYFKFVYLIGFLFFVGCQSFQFDPWPDTGEGVYHTVQKGQTLYGIAQAYNLDVKVLRRANYIRDASKLKVGTQLWVPGARRVLQILSSGKTTQRTLKQDSSPSSKARKGYFIWPTKGTLTSGFGMRKKRKHEGIDIAAKKGTPIYAAAAGEIAFSGWGPTGYGKMIIVKHKYRLTTLYAHNSKLLVKKGTRVKQGQKISLMGSTGRSTGPHLHFEVRNNARAKDPLKYLPVKR